MLIPDVNILVYAHDSHAREFEIARQWWERALIGAVAFGFARLGVTGATPLGSLFQRLLRVF